MTFEITQKIETNKLFYLRKIQYFGYRGENQKSFVRTDYEKKDGSIGSKLYCCSKIDALLFTSSKDAELLLKKHNCENEHVNVIEEKEYNKYYKEFVDKYYILKEVEVEGVKCYKFVYKK